ncbi:MAG: hypothetical protein EOM28_10050 [Clostridia bacterium]|nr:hypothetical protein [Clostridia bacterium]
MKLKLGYFVLIMTAIIAFTGCTGKEENATALIQTAQEKMGEITSLQAKMNMNVKMNMDSEEIATVTTADISAFREPMKMKLAVSSYMENDPSQKNIVEMYLQENDAGVTAYSNAGTGWVCTKPEKESLGQFEVYDNVLRYLSTMENPVSKGTEKIGEVSTKRVEGILTGETMEQIIEESGILNSALNVGITEEELQGMYSEINGLPVTLWIGADGLVYQYETDISQLVQIVMDKTIELMGTDQVDEGTSVTIQEAKISMLCSDFNAVQDFEIPAEALAAKQ